MRLSIQARYPDYDSKGHLNNAVYLTYFEMARAGAWLEAMRQPTDFPFIIAEASVRYVSQARLGEPLVIEIATGEIRNKAWVWRYRLLDARDDRLIAEGSTVQVMFDYATQRTTAIPDPLRELLARV
jgi:acyl-CoA thioester hydrolase